jgi:FxsC-like protein
MSGTIAAARKDYRFFLSYSRRDALDVGKTENVWFVQFRNDLIRDVAREANLPTAVPEDDVAFYDRDGIKTGDHWSEVLAEALQTSRVLVCLYSQNYFTSEYCGKEFRVFSERIDAFENANKGVARPAAIIPILWDGPGKLPALPPSVSGLQFIHSDLGPLYAEKGLAFLLRMKEEKAYQEFLFHIAEVIAAAGAVALPREKQTRPLAKIESAFHASPALPAAGALPATKGVKSAWLVYVAGAGDDYQGLRQHRDAYGASADEWQPYHPDAEAYLGAVATNVVSGMGLIPHPLAVSTRLVENLQDAEDTNTLAVVIVDPWSVKITTLQAAMRALDRARLTNCGVIIVSNQKDPEPPHEKADVEQQLRTVLSRIWLTRDMYLQDAVHSEEDLRKALAVAIEQVRRRISDRGRLLRGESSAEEFPTLPTSAPSAAAQAEVQP